MTEKPERLMTTQEIADYLRCNKKQVYLFRDTGLLKMTRYGRSYVATISEVKRFQEETEGADLASRADMVSWAEATKRHRKARFYA
jgi:hypothetical protein